ncbi:hypothetical protein Peur_010778 [Populus x canadensis]
MKQSFCISCVFCLFFPLEVSNCHGTVKKKRSSLLSNLFPCSRYCSVEIPLFNLMDHRNSTCQDSLPGFHAAPSWRSGNQSKFLIKNLMFYYLTWCKFVAVSRDAFISALH